ncbi:hypothetical protein IP70_19485 [alpha proteobacterium AAP38]|nr:hypothetical protein IP70_19485 [alpha proteobacterium AAP38]
MFPLGVDRIREVLQQHRVISEGRDVDPMDVLGACEEVVVASGADSVEGRVDLGLARDED